VVDSDSLDLTLGVGTDLLNLLGGNLKINSHPGAGTSVEAFLPYSGMETEAVDEDTPVPG